MKNSSSRYIYGWNQGKRKVKGKDISVIPKGDYCHFPRGMKKVCPYWSLKEGLPLQENGYCSFIEKSDWDINEERKEVEVTTYNKDRSVKSVTMEDAHIYTVSLLWDQCKECGVKE